MSTRSASNYVMGSGNHARNAVAPEPSRTRLQELPLGWYSEKGGSLGDESGLRPSGLRGFRAPRSITSAVLATTDIRIFQRVLIATRPGNVSAARCRKESIASGATGPHRAMSTKPPEAIRRKWCGPRL